MSIESKTRKRVFVVFPTAWDEKQLRAPEARWRERFEVELASPSDHDWPWNFDVVGFIEEQVAARRGTVDGVMSSSDYPGATVAGAISQRLGLPGSPPESVIRCSHKYYSRVEQREAVPEHTAEFHLVDPKLPRGGLEQLKFPRFIKPVKGAFSVMSAKLRSVSDLDEFLAKPAVEEFLSYYVHVFNNLVRALTSFEVNGSYFILEEFLKGRQVTLEGFATEGEVEILGIVDSVRHSKTKSFVRFDYPSSLPQRVQARMHEVARKTIERLGLRSTLFNIEMTYDVRRDRIFIVEVNPRMCGQFADLYEKVDGINGYEVALALAVGERPRLRRGAGAYGVASSYPLRIFEPARVVGAPGPEAISEVERRFTGTLVWPECSLGDRLADFESVEDGKSVRYAVVNLGASDRDALPAKFEEVSRALDYRFEPIR